MTIAQIKEVVEAFAEGARRAREAGLDGVELHGANGYLITQFLSSAINDRKDEYGGSIENRARFVLDIVKAIRAKVGRDFHLQMKISAEDHADAIAFFGIGPSGNTLDESIKVCKMAGGGRRRCHPRVDRGVLPASSQSGRRRSAGRGAGPDLRHDDLERRRPPIGTYNLFRNFPGLARRQWNDAAPKPHEIEGANLANARKIKAAVGVPVICTGGFQTARSSPTRIKRGDCDWCRIARPLIANNDLVHIFAPRAEPARRSPARIATSVWRTCVENPLGCYDESRFPTSRGDDGAGHDRVRPAAVPGGCAAPAAAEGVADRTRDEDAVADAAAGESTSSAARSGVSDALQRKIGGLFQNREWYRLPRVLSHVPAGRNAQRAAREEPARHRGAAAREAGRSRADLDPAIRESRTTDGSHNDLQYPQHGIGRLPLRPQRAARAHRSRHRQSAGARTRASSAAS